MAWIAKRKYVILAVKKWGGEVEALKEMECSEERAVVEAVRIFNKCGMQKVGVLDNGTLLIFKDTRKCRCTNQQLCIDGTYVCMDCKVEINYDAWISGEMPEEVVESELGAEEYSKEDSNVTANT